MASKTSSVWRLRARRIIQETLAALPANADDKACVRALRDAYPVSWQRSGWVYQCWLKERRAALMPVVKPPKPTVGWYVGPPPKYLFGVDCGWCRRRQGGCLMCGPHWERLVGDLQAGGTLALLLKAVRADTCDSLLRLVLADWFFEHDYPELAELFRATCEDK